MAKLNKYFDSKEFACKCGCGMDGIDPELLFVITDIREHFRVPIIINSACRCETHNTNVGSNNTSQHILGTAADIDVRDVNPDDIANYLERKYPNKYGIGKYKTFTHIDVRSTKGRWDYR